MTIRFFTAGESHGPGLTAIVDGIPAGLHISAEDIQVDLARRQAGYGAGPRMKLEQDQAQITGGILEGKTTGAPVSLFIPNQDHIRWAGKPVAAFPIPRPGHADLTGAAKYGFTDMRPPLERASARETAARVAVGAVCRAMLQEFGIRVGGYVVSIGEVEGRVDVMPYAERIERARASSVSCPDGEAGDRMQARIRRAMDEKDTLGGIIEGVALGLPPGLGSYSQWDKRLEARLGAAVLSIQAVKGVEFGPAFENTRKPGTQVHDSIYLEGERLVRKTNRAGGLEGGISNGEPLIVRAALKPIATTLTPLETVDLSTGEAGPTRYERSDFCPVPRAVVIVESMMAIVLADALVEKLGGDSISEMRPRFDTLRQMTLTDLRMDGVEHTWWPQ
jgi:chorismate synthase